MDKAQVQKMIEEKLEIISTLQNQVNILRAMMGEPTATGKPTVKAGSDIAKSIEAYRQKIMADVERSIPNIPSAGGFGAPPNFAEMKSRMEKGIKNSKKE